MNVWETGLQELAGWDSLYYYLSRAGKQAGDTSKSYYF